MTNNAQSCREKLERSIKRKKEQRKKDERKKKGRKKGIKKYRKDEK